MATSPNDHDVTMLWQEYKRTGDRDLRNRLVLQYSPLVKYVAGRVRSGLPHTVDSADLVSDGVIGLIDAIDKFEPERGLQFQTYAVPRIRGAIIDSLRAADWVPRSLRNKVRDIEQAQLAVEQRLGRTASDHEIAEELQIPVLELRETQGKVSYTNMASLDELGGVEDLSPVLTDVIEHDETRALLMQAVSHLPERDRIIIALYYFEALTLSEIGQVLGVTESRVSQLHTRATLALRARLSLEQVA